MEKRTKIIIWVVVGIIIAFIIGKIFLKGFLEGKKASATTTDENTTSDKIAIDCQSLSEDEKRSILASGNYTCK